MSRYYLINLAGGTISEENSKDIPHPYLELGLHITMKTTQAFALLGLSAVGPILGLVKGNDVRESAFKCGQYGAVSGAIFGPILSMMVMRKMSEDGAYDRAYRLRHNKGQNNVDRLSLLGAAAALGAANYTCTSDKKAASKSAVIGLTGGVILAALYNNFLRS